MFYDTAGNMTEEIKFDSDTGLPEKNSYTYDALGKMLTHHLELEHDGVSETFVFTRDEKGRVTSEVKLYGDDPGERTNYSYDAHEHPNRIEKFDADGEPESVETVTYDAKNLPVTIVKSDGTGKTEEITGFEYNDEGRPLKRTTHGPDQKLLKEMTFAYNDRGDVTRVTEKNAEGVITSDIMSVYDDRGNVTERRIRDFHSRILKFTYDDRNNCIEEDMLDENGNLIMKNTFEFDAQNNLLAESGYYMDMNRSQERANTVSRFEYEFYTEE
jgi:YD repeat-containing protein